MCQIHGSREQIPLFTEQGKQPIGLSRPALLEEARLDMRDGILVSMAHPVLGLSAKAADERMGQARVVCCWKLA